MKITVELNTDDPRDADALYRLLNQSATSPVARVKSGPIGLVVDNSEEETTEAPVEEEATTADPERVEADVDTSLRTRILEKASGLTRTPEGVATVKAALKVIGARRVSTVSDDQLEAFAEALGGLD